MKRILLLVFAFASLQLSAQTLVDFHTTKGSFRVELREDLMPITAGNFIKLADSGYYDGIIFHRVIKGFMIQGGDPTGTGTGGPGYTIEDEYDSTMNHDSAGVISMANTGAPNSGGSQFFITLNPQPHLDGKHAVFGAVIQGMENVYEIGNVRTTGSRPQEDVVMKKVEISDGGVLSIERPNTEVLTEAYPNPFAASVHINFEVKKQGTVRAAIYDSQGRLVETLVQSHQKPGIVSVDWNASSFDTGIYYLQINTSTGTKTMRLNRVGQ